MEFFDHKICSLALSTPQTALVDSTSPSNQSFCSWSWIFPHNMSCASFKICFLHIQAAQELSWQRSLSLEWSHHGFPRSSRSCCAQSARRAHCTRAPLQSQHRIEARCQRYTSAKQMNFLKSSRGSNFQSKNHVAKFARWNGKFSRQRSCLLKGLFFGKPP